MEWIYKIVADIIAFTDKHMIWLFIMFIIWVASSPVRTMNKTPKHLHHHYNTGQDEGDDIL